MSLPQLPRHERDWIPGGVDPSNGAFHLKPQGLLESGAVVIALLGPAPNIFVPYRFKNATDCRKPAVVPAVVPHVMRLGIQVGGAPARQQPGVFFAAQPG